MLFVCDYLDFVLCSLMIFSQTGDIYIKLRKEKPLMMHNLHEENSSRGFVEAVSQWQ